MDMLSQQDGWHVSRRWKRSRTRSSLPRRSFPEARVQGRAPDPVGALLQSDVIFAADGARGAVF